MLPRTTPRTFSFSSAARRVSRSDGEAVVGFPLPAKAGSPQPGLLMVPEFANEPLTDFEGSAPDRQAMEAALREVKGEFDRQWPLVIGGRRVTTSAWIESRNPCLKQQVVGRVARAGKPEAELAL